MKDGIEQRGTSTWRITVAAGRDPETGAYRRIRETVRGTKADARRRRDELRVEVARGTAVQPDAETVAAFLERWIAHRERIGKVRPKTAYCYRGHVRRIVTPRIGTVRLSDVRPAHLQTVLDSALDAGAAPRTVLQVHRILHAAFRQAVRWQAIGANPADGVTPPRIEPAKLTIPTPTQLQALFGAIADDYRAPLAVSAMTGLRRGEVLALTWDAISLDSRPPSLQVRGTLQRTPEGLQVLGPKTSRSRRTVTLPATLAATLQAHRESQDARREIAGEAWGSGDYVFDRGDGQPVDPDAFGAAFRAARDAAGLSGVRLHDLRHAFATMQIAEGRDPRLVSDLLGHATVAFTLQTYVHPDADAAAAAAETTERILGSVMTG